LKFFWLNFHLTYACRHSGVCCSSGWPIPVERDHAIPIRNLARRQDDAWLIHDAGAPDEVAGTLALQSNGHCVFHSAGGCGVYAARPVSCAHFPYVCLIDQRGVHVTLSHYCPTAAALLFDDDGPIEIVEGPSPVPGFDIPEGLDAREALPPLESPGRLMTLEALSAWERELVAAPLASLHGYDRSALFEHARRAVPKPLSWPDPPADADRAWREWVEPGLIVFAPVIGRYLAAKAFASWALYSEVGTPAVLRLVATARAVLEMEAARVCSREGVALDAVQLTHAIRQSDLLLVHYADPDRLHQRPDVR
jgi:Fe-S-cluster containining protein